MDALKWCQIEADESPVCDALMVLSPSERKAIYQKYIALLIDKGKAYYAFDSAEELELHGIRLKESGGLNTAPTTGTI